MTRKTSSKHHSHYLSGLGGKHKFTTRHLAALDFLLNVPLKNEVHIIEHGTNMNKRKKQHESQGDNNDEYDESETELKGSLSLTETEGATPLITTYLQKDDGATHAPGKKLQGRAAVNARVPLQFRYQLSRPTGPSALVRQWEDSLLRGQCTGVGQPPQPLLESRVFCSRVRGYPTAVFSVVKYAPEEEAKRQEARRTEDTRGLDIFVLPQRDWRGVSYTPLLQLRGLSTGFLYDPNSLDDPDMLQGKHRYLLNGKANTGPVVSSVVLFVNAVDLKQSLNDQFREKHPLLPPSLTLSKVTLSGNRNE